MSETPSTSQFSALNTPDTVPMSNPTTESPFVGLKMADTTSKTNLTTESPFGLLKTAGTAPKSNLIPYSPFSSSKALSTDPVHNPATISPFGLFKLPNTASSSNPAITSPFGVSETVPTNIPATTGPFGKFEMFVTAPTPTTVSTNPFGALRMNETAPKPNLATNSPFGVFNTADTARTPSSAINSQFGVFNRLDTTCTPNSATNSPFGGFNMTDTARTPNLAPKSLFSTVKTPAENIFSKSNLPKSDTEDSQANGLFGKLSEQATQSKINSFGFGPTGSSPSLFAPSKLSGFDMGNGDSLKIYHPAIFNESKLPPIEPGFSSEMAIAEELSNTDQPIVPFDHYQLKDDSLSSPFKSLLQTDNALPSANNIMGDSTTTQQTANQFGGSPFNIPFQKSQDLIPYPDQTHATVQEPIPYPNQTHAAVQEPRSSKTWLFEQNEILSRNLAISKQNFRRNEAKLQYFAKRYNDIYKVCKKCKEEIAKLYEELDMVDDIYEVSEVEKEKVKLVLAQFRKEEYTSFFQADMFFIFIFLFVFLSAGLQ